MSVRWKVGRLPERDRERTGVVTNLAVQEHDVAEVAVAALVERAQQPDARLHRGDDATPGNLEGRVHAIRGERRDGIVSARQREVRHRWRGSAPYEALVQESTTPGE